MKSLLIIILIILTSFAYPQSWQWSQPIALTDSSTDNINVSFASAGYGGWIENNFMLWEKNYDDSSAILKMKLINPEKKYVVCFSDSGFNVTNPCGTIFSDSTIFVIWQSNENGDYELYGGYSTGNRLSGFRQITYDSLDDVNPVFNGFTLVWERNGRIISSEITLIDTALFTIGAEAQIDSGGCRNPDISLSEQVAYEKESGDSAAIFYSWKNGSNWELPICVYSNGDNRLPSFSKTAEILHWQNNELGDWAIKVCELYYTSLDTTNFNFSSKDEKRPVSVFIDIPTKEADLPWATFAFESDSTGDNEIFAIDNSIYQDTINISQFSGNDIKPEFSFWGWEDAGWNFYRIWLTWQSERNNKWQLWSRYFDVYIAGIEEKSQLIPNIYILHQNYPNPFNSQTSIKYYLPKADNVKIEVFNVLGQKIKTLINQNQQRGEYQVIWDGMDENNLPVASGIYIYNLTSGKYSTSKKLLLLK